MPPPIHRVAKPFFNFLLCISCINETKIIAREYAEKAEEILKIFPQNIYNDALVALTKFVFTRSN